MAEEKILDRITKLLALAEHPNTPAPEAETALLQANKLIAKHALDEAIIRSRMSESERKALVGKKIVVAEGYSRFAPALRSILLELARTFRCSAAVVGQYVHAFGTEEDVRWLEHLYTTIHFQFLNRINPKWDESKSYDENVYNFKVAGYKWADINKQSMKHGGPDARVWKEDYASEYGISWREHRNYDAERSVAEFPTEKIKGTMIAAYKRHAKLVGDTEPVQTQNKSAFQAAFTEGYKIQMMRRLRRMQDDAQREYDTIPGAAVALTDVMEEAKRMMWAEYPELSPEELQKRRDARIEQERRDREERERMLAAMTPKQRNDFLAKEEREQARAARASQRYWDKEYDKLSRSGGALVGSSAANDVDLSRKAGSVPNQDRAAIG